MATSAAKAAEVRGKTIEIVKPELAHLIAEIECTTPLLINPLTHRYVRSMDNSTTAGPVKLTPEQEYQEKLEARELNGKYYVPVEMFIGNNGALVEASKMVRLKKVTSKIVQAAISIEHDAILKAPEGLRPCIEIHSDAGPVMDFHMAAVLSKGTRVSIPVYRPRFDDCAITLRIEYWVKLINQAALVSLLTTAGVLGIGAYRRGGFGKFKVLKATEVRG
jgi:hypothetical protein